MLWQVMKKLNTGLLSLMAARLEMPSITTSRLPKAQVDGIHLPNEAAGDVLRAIIGDVKIRGDGAVGQILADEALACA